MESLLDAPYPFEDTNHSRYNIKNNISDDLFSEDEAPPPPPPRGRRRKKKNNRRRFSRSPTERRRDLNLMEECQKLKREMVHDHSGHSRSTATPEPVLSPDDIDGILNDLVWEEFIHDCSMRRRSRDRIYI